MVRSGWGSEHASCLPVALCRDCWMTLDLGVLTLTSSAWVIPLAFPPLSDATLTEQQCYMAMNHRIIAADLPLQTLAVVLP